MKQLSTGQPSTLGSYRANCQMFGFDKAAEYFDLQIAEAPNGADEEVVADESQMMQVIVALESQP